MSTLTKFIQANCNTVVYNQKMKGDDFAKTQKNKGITRLRNNTLRLFSFEINFINTSVKMGKNGESPNIIYIGFSPGTHLIKLMNFYPFINFYLFDEVEISSELKSYAYNHDNVEIFETMPTDEHFELLNEMENTYLISNYTSTNTRKNQNIEEADDEKRLNLHMEKERDNLTDSVVNMEFARKINAVCSLLKFRPPHIHTEAKLKLNGLDELISGEFTFYNGIILLPIFSGAKSSECRMIVTNYRDKIPHNYINITHIINKWNFSIKEMPALNPFNGSKTPLPYQLGNQFEISVFFAILKDYFNSIGVENVSVDDVYNLYTSIINIDESNSHCK